MIKCLIKYILFTAIGASFYIHFTNNMESVVPLFKRAKPFNIVKPKYLKREILSHRSVAPRTTEKRKLKHDAFEHEPTKY